MESYLYENILYNKKSFAKNENKQFYIGKKIHNQDIYDELVNIQIKNNGNINEKYLKLS